MKSGGNRRRERSSADSVERRQVRIQHYPLTAKLMDLARDVIASACEQQVPFVRPSPGHKEGHRLCLAGELLEAVDEYSVSCDAQHKE